MPDGEDSRARLLTLDGLRGLGALSVMLYHCGFVLKTPFVTHGHIAVDFFFLLSGFIMARTYQHRLAAGDTGAFFRARLVRLWPLMAIGCCYGLAAALALYPTTPVLKLAIKFGLAILCVPLISSVPFPLNAPQWSLLFEGVANICHALFLRRLAPFALGAIVLISAAGLVAGVAAHQDLNGAYRGAAMLTPLLRLVFSYCLGLLIYVLPRPKIRLPFWAAAVVFAAVALFPDLPAAPVFDLVAVLVVWPLLLVGSIDASAVSGVPASALRLAGALSYPLYILHYPTLMLVIHFGAGWSPAVLIPIGVGLSLAAAWAGMLLDRPARKAFAAALATVRPPKPLASGAAPS